MLETLRHELMHAMFFLTGIHALLSSELQEVIIILMDSFFYDVVKEAEVRVDTLLQKEATKQAK